MKHRIQTYLFNLFIGLDQLLNVVAGGDPDETVSSRLGRIKIRNHGRIPWRRPVAKCVDFVLEHIDAGHSVAAIEPGKGSEGVTDRPSPRDIKWWDEYGDERVFRGSDLTHKHRRTTQERANPNKRKEDL